MDNAVRSQRTKDAAINAALTIIVRDGAGRLTIDAIARESGISKGGVLHQFRTKDAVLRALLENQIEQGEMFFQACLAKRPPGQPSPVLAAQIATLRNAAEQPQATTFAIASVMHDAPELQARVQANSAQRIAEIKAEAHDVKTAMLRWAAAQGLALSTILGHCPVSKEERDQLFDQLLDDQAWPGINKNA
jgi:AcrR family transcriptional regulator